MRTPKIYIETSVFNFYFTDDAPERRENTLRLFEEISMRRYVPYTSKFVVEELLRATEPRRTAMLDLITRYSIEVLPDTQEVRRLAALYVAKELSRQNMQPTRSTLPRPR